MSTGNYPVSMYGRRSNGMDEEDWQHLASAYDTWNDHLAVTEVIDEDLRAFVKDVFEDYGLWNPILEEPDLEQYRRMFYNLC